jgi:hypothetical protein
VIKVEARARFSIAARRFVPAEAVVILAVLFCGVFFEVVTDYLTGRQLANLMRSRKDAKVAKTQRRGNPKRISIRRLNFAFLTALRLCHLCIFA